LDLRAAAALTAGALRRTVGREGTQMAKQTRKTGEKPRLAPRGGSRGSRAAGSGRADRAAAAPASGRDEEGREAVRQSRPSRSSAASGRVTGALRRDEAVRGRHEDDAPLPAGPTASARRDAVAPLAERERVPADEPQHVPSPTAIAAEALRSGVVPNAVPPSPDQKAIPGESDAIKAGDPDDETLRNEYVGEETPGGSTPTPDQGNVDDIGRAFGVQEEDSGELRTSTEVMGRRDERRRAGYPGKGPRS
jgi:hypothetical protein